MVFFIATSLNWAILLCCRLAVFLSVTHWACVSEDVIQIGNLRRDRSAILFSFRKQNRAGCTAFPGGRGWPSLFLLYLSCSVPLSLTPPGWGEAPNGGLFLWGFVLSVVQRSHATVDVPNQPPLLCSASSTIPGTSSSMALLIQSACRELWVHRLAGTLVLCRGAGLAPVLYSLPADMPPKQVIQVCDVRKSLRIETLFPMSYHQHEGN